MSRVHAAPPPSQQSAVARLVEAEQAWQARLDAARAAAARVVAAAEAEVRAAEPALDEARRAAVERRTAELRAGTLSAAQSAAGDLGARTARYANASAELVDRVANEIARRAPWFDTQTPEAS